MYIYCYIFFMCEFDGVIIYIENINRLVSIKICNVLLMYVCYDMSVILDIEC